MQLSKVFYIGSIILICIGLFEVCFGNSHNGISWQIWGLIAQVRAKQLEDDE